MIHVEWKRFQLFALCRFPYFSTYPLQTTQNIYFQPCTSVSQYQDKLLISCKLLFKIDVFVHMHNFYTERESSSLLNRFYLFWIAAAPFYLKLNLFLCNPLPSSALGQNVVLVEVDVELEFCKSISKEYIKISASNAGEKLL